MRILIGMGHPAHVHFFKNTIWNLEKGGHEVKIVVRPRKVALELVKAYGLDYELFGKYRNNLITKTLEIPYNDYIFYKVAKDFRPDILTGILNYTSAHIEKLIRKPSIIFTDTENAILGNLITLPFSTVICTPSCFKKDLGKKQVRYNGYHELAYLHPNYFKPDSRVLDNFRLNKKDKFIVLRFVSWSASHDIGDKGFDSLDGVIKTLEKYGQILITSERKLNKNLEKYKITAPPENIHHLMSYAQMYIGESATMASECAVMGTPALFVSTSRRGYTDEEESKYGLVYNFSDAKDRQKQAIEKAEELLNDKNLKNKWQKKRKKMLNEKIDVTKFMTDFIENYPESFYKYKNTTKGVCK
jgi:predicted glycosyltransferase